MKFKSAVMLLSALLFCIAGCKQFSAALDDAFGDGKKENFKEDNNYDPAEEDNEPEKEKEFEYVLSFHRVPTRQTDPDMITRTVYTAGSLDPVVIEKNMFSHSRDIDKIEVIPSETRPGFYGLAIHFNSRGRKRWTSLTASSLGCPVAIVIDGEFYRTFVIDKIFDSEHEEWAYLNINLPERSAKKISGAAEKNHKHFNKKPTDLWTL